MSSKPIKNNCYTFPLCARPSRLSTWMRGYYDLRRFLEDEPYMPPTDNANTDDLVEMVHCTRALLPFPCLIFHIHQYFGVNCFMNVIGSLRYIANFHQAQTNHQRKNPSTQGAYCSPCVSHALLLIDFILRVSYNIGRQTMPVCSADRMMQPDIPTCSLLHAG